MGWGPTLGVVLLTAAAGMGAAAGLANFLIYWQQIPNREGASGYFAVTLIGFGLAGGIVVGLITALLVRSGFWKAQGFALGAVVLLTVVAGILAVVLDDNGPTLDGEKLVAEVELKCPAGWKPDNKGKWRDGSFCWIQEKAADGPQEVNPIVLGAFALKENDGQWSVSCAVPLTKSSKNRYLRVFVGRRADVTIRIPLPARPKAAHREWSPWSANGFLAQSNQPAAADYSFRYRVQAESAYDREHPDPAAAFQEARQRALAAMPKDAPVEQWLPFFENERGQAIAYSAGSYPEVEAVKAQPLALIPLLRSSDAATVRRAVFAAGALEQIPGPLIEPLAAAGRRTIEMMREARAGALPEDPDLGAEDRAYTFFFYWKLAMDRAGAAGAAARHAVMEQIRQAAGEGSGEGGIRRIAEETGKELGH